MGQLKNLAELCLSATLRMFADSFIIFWLYIAGFCYISRWVRGVQKIYILLPNFCMVHCVTAKSILFKYNIFERTLIVPSLLTGNIFYLMEFREIFLTLLRKFDERLQPRSFLRDLVESTHLFLRMLERFCKGRNNLLVQVSTTWVVNWGETQWKTHCPTANLREISVRIFTCLFCLVQRTWVVIQILIST